ncbi:MAG: PQ-loop domain-containing transporter [Actinomycetota bacterium]
MLLAEVFGFIAAALGVMQGLPQARRVKSLGHSRGVSLAMWMLMTSSSAAWLGYGIRTDSPSLIVSTVATGLNNARVVLAITDDARRVVPRILAAFLVVVAVAAVGPLWVVNPALFAVTLSRVPQIIRSWRSRRTGLESSAVSVGSIALSMGCLLSWEVYSVLLRSPTLIGTTTMALMTNIVVAWLELSGRNRAREHAA